MKSQAYLATILAVLLGCSSRLPADARHALSVTAIESARDLRERKGSALRDGYRRTLAVLCAIVERDASQGRGWVEWIVGFAGVTGDGPNGRLDPQTANACEESR